MAAPACTTQEIQLFQGESMHKRLVIGASGQVGTQMLATLGEQALPTSRVAREGWLQMDVAEIADASDAAALLDPLDLSRIDCVGGMTWVDGCEAQPELAWRTNARGPGALAAYARQRKLPYVFFSSDYVFGGTADDPGPYDEDSPTHPLSVYGKTKLEGEERVLAAYPEALVLRTNVVYGADPREKNFLYSLMRSLSAGSKLRVPMDQVSTPTYNRDLIAVTEALMAAGASGIFHAGGPEAMDRLTFAQRIAAWLGLDTSLIEGVTTAELAQPAPRPLAAGLHTKKLQQLYPELRMRGLLESLEDCGTQLREFLERPVA